MTTAFVNKARLTWPYKNIFFCVCFGSCVQSMMCLALSNSRCLMPNVSRTFRHYSFIGRHCFLLGHCLSTCSPSVVSLVMTWFFFMILVGNDSLSSPGPLTLSLLVSFTASSKTISGLLEFDSKTEAVEVLTVLNHYQIRIPSKSVSKTTQVL